MDTGDMSLTHVLDLPQLYTKPLAADILQALEALTVRPSSFKQKLTSEQTLYQLAPRDVARYLTSIISSALSWVDSDELRDAIWDAASARLCERAGRSAMSSISREFTIPMTQTQDFQVMLHEPSITSDNLGMKTWVSSYLLAKRLHKLVLPDKGFTCPPKKADFPRRFIELGAGTGLVGISLAALCGPAATVHLTDLDPIVPNLTHNVSLNGDLLAKTGSTVSTGVLDWSTIPGEGAVDNDKYDLIVAADSLYSPDHPRWLVQTIERLLTSGADARVIVELPLRDAYLPQVREFSKRMSMIGFKVLQEGEEIGYDDWEGNDGSSLEVRCWWSQWGWEKKV